LVTEHGGGGTALGVALTTQANHPKSSTSGKMGGGTGHPQTVYTVTSDDIPSIVAQNQVQVGTTLGVVVPPRQHSERSLFGFGN
jgi:hypothetical protein